MWPMPIVGGAMHSTIVDRRRGGWGGRRAHGSHGCRVPIMAPFHCWGEPCTGASLRAGARRVPFLRCGSIALTPLALGCCARHPYLMDACAMRPAFMSSALVGARVTMRTWQSQVLNGLSHDKPGAALMTGTAYGARGRRVLRRNQPRTTGPPGRTQVL